MKTFSIKVFCFFCALCCFFACQQDKAKITEIPTSKINVAPIAGAKPEMWLYHITLDKFRMRETPDQKSKVISQFELGDFVEGTGEKSAKKEEIMLRGRVFLEPYFQVTALRPEEEKGWMYGGGLLPVFGGKRQDSPDLSKLSQFSMFLKTLNIKQIGSGKKAWDYVRNNFKEGSPSLFDAVYVLLDNHLRNMEFEGEFYTETEKIKWTEEDFNAVYDKKFDNNKYPFTKLAAETGFCLASAEGTIFPVVDYKKLSDFFSTKLSPAMQSFVNQTVVEQNDELFSDGGIVGEINLVADRAVFWEKFNAENPYFLKSEETQHSQAWYNEVTFIGLNNTPLSDSETKAITPEFKSLLEHAIKTYPNSKYGAAVKDFYELCASEGWKVTEKVQKLQEKYIAQ